MAGCRCGSRACPEDRKGQGGPISPHRSRRWGIAATRGGSVGESTKRRRLASGIASSAPRANIDAVLEKMAVESYFQAIVSAEDVRRGKPDRKCICWQLRDW